MVSWLPYEVAFDCGCAALRPGVELSRAYFSVSRFRKASRTWAAFS